MDKLDYDGFEIANKLKESELTDNFPVIMVSSNDQQGNYVRSKSLGVDHYLIQPFESNELFRILVSTFNGIREQGSINNVVNKIRPDLKILLIEDNILRQRNTRNIFKKLSYEIDIAKNGGEAIEKLSSLQYDIVFMDPVLPDMDGPSAIREIRKKFGEKLPLIMITSDRDKEPGNEAMTEGIDDHVPKPVKVESIKQILQKFFYESV
jgi:CheY-like chemotaxis protein